MNILICGDIVGKSGRDVIERLLPDLKSQNDLDFVIVNAENSASGFGITKKICDQLYALGVDVITSGNHIWDQKEIINYIDNDKRLIRPCNYSSETPGRGYCVFKLNNGNLISVINVMCRLFMDNIDDPFKSVDEILNFLDKKLSNTIIILEMIVLK